MPSPVKVAAADRLDTLPAGVPDLTLGWEALAWAAKYLRHPDGAREGERWKFTPRQARFILWYYAVDEDGKWLYGHAARRLSKGSGKSPFAAVMAVLELLAPVRFHKFVDGVPGGCVGKRVAIPWVQIAAASADQPLALDTPVRTTDGWKTVGTLQIGDYVFGSDGEPVEVKRHTETFYNHRCYEITFDNGEKITADENHGWTVERLNGHGDKWETQTVTTANLAEYKKRFPNRTTRIPVVPARYERQQLPLDPWRLGFWLGDGAKKSGVHAIDWRLKDELELMYRPLLEWWEDLRFDHRKDNWGAMNVKRRDGICPRGHDYMNTPENLHYQNGNPACRRCVSRRIGYKDTKLPSMLEQLREIGVLNNKHIPQEYLEGDYDQRMALLQGLVDSDGGVEKCGRAYFVNTNEKLIEGMQDLLSSLGLKWSKQYTPATNSWKVSFKPRNGEPVARFNYKSVRTPITPSERYLKYHRIVSVEEVPSVPVRCIGIDNEDHLFQVGKTGILTHNTRNTMAYVRALVSPHLAPELHRDYNLDVGKEKIYVDGTGVLEIITSSASSAEGSRATCIIADELEHWLPSNGGVELFRTLKANLTKTGSRMLETLNAWIPDAGSAGEETFKAWCDIEDGVAREVKMGILYDAVQAPPGTELSDEDSLRSALEFVYEDCPWSLEHLDSIISDIYTSRDPSEARRKYLNQNVASEDSWVTPQAWASLAKPERVVEPGEDIAMFFDGSLSRDATALIGVCMSDGHIFTLGIWEPGNSHKGNSGRINPHAVDARVQQAFDRYNVLAFFADVREWEGYVHHVWAERYRDRLSVWASPRGELPSPIAWDMRTKLKDFTMAAELCEAEITQGQFTHDGNPLLANHVRNARRYENRWGISIAKESKNSAAKIDAAVCVIGARHVYRLVKEGTYSSMTYEAFFA